MGLRDRTPGPQRRTGRAKYGAADGPPFFCPEVDPSGPSTATELPVNDKKMSTQLIRLRYRTMCSVCGRELPPGSRAAWNREARKATCADCTGTIAATSAQAGDTSTALDRGEAGASARRRYTALHERREREAREKLGRSSGIYLALTNEPQSTRAWAVGARGEHALGAFLEDLHDGQETFVLHDRRIPRRRANVDHLVIASGGVFVIDAKRYEGKIRRVDRGGFFSLDERLYVGRRDCTKLVAGMAKQGAAVRDALTTVVVDEAIPITPVLCFVASDWSLFARPFQLGGVWVEWPGSLRKRVQRGGPLGPDRVASIARRLSESLRPA
jgi:hypothetical protein